MRCARQRTLGIRMRPDLLGGEVYPAFVLLAAFAGLLVSLFAARRAGLPLPRLVLLLILVVAATLAGARLFRLWEMGAHGWSFSLNGLRYPGGLIAFLVALPLLARAFGLSIAALADVVAPGIGISLAIVRIGCLLEGCCFGTVSGLPWAITFPLRSKAWAAQVAADLIPRTHLHSLPVHPLQVYFGLWSLFAALLAFRAQRRPHRPGDVILLFLFVHEGGKALLESLRVPHRPGLQIASALVCAGAAALWLARRRASTGAAAPVALAAPQG